MLLLLSLSVSADSEVYDLLFEMVEGRSSLAQMRQLYTQAVQQKKARQAQQLAHGIFNLSGHQVTKAQEFPGNGLPRMPFLVFTPLAHPNAAPLNRLAYKLQQMHPTFALVFSAHVIVSQGYGASSLKYRPHTALLLPLQVIYDLDIAYNMLIHEMVHMNNHAHLLRGRIPPHRGALYAMDPSKSNQLLNDDPKSYYRKYLSIDELEAFATSPTMFRSRRTINESLDRFIQRASQYRHRDLTATRTTSYYPGITKITFNFPAINTRWVTYIYNNDTRSYREILDDELFHLKGLLGQARQTMAEL